MKSARQIRWSYIRWPSISADPNPLVLPPVPYPPAADPPESIGQDPLAPSVPDPLSMAVEIRRLADNISANFSWSPAGVAPPGGYRNPPMHPGQQVCLPQRIFSFRDP